MAIFSAVCVEDEIDRRTCSFLEGMPVFLGILIFSLLGANVVAKVTRRGDDMGFRDDACRRESENIREQR